MATSKYDGSIILSTKVDTTGLNKGMSTMKSGVSSLTASFSKLAGVIGIAFGVGALVSFGKRAVELASDLQEVQNVVDVAFGNMAYRMEKFADTAVETFGISELTAKQTGSSFMSMAKGLQFADDVAADMALTLTGLSADMASFYNIQQSEAKTALSAVYTGETETLKRYGILITEVNLQEFARQQGITKSINAMTQQEKVMLRYQYVLQATALAQGDFVRTQDSWANQTRILSERWKEMSAIFGEAFMAIGSLVLPTINKIISGLIKVAEVAQIASQYIYKAFTGKNLELLSAEQQSDAISGSVKNQEDLTKAVEETAKAQEKVLAGFDDINILAESASETANNTSDLSGLNIAAMPNTLTTSTKSDLDTKELEKAAKVIERILKPFEIFKNIDFTKLSTSLKKLVDPLNSIGDTTLSNWEWLIVDVFEPLSKFTIEEILSRVIDSISSSLKAFDKVYDEASQTVKDFKEHFIDPISDFVKPYFLDFLDSFNEKWEELCETIENTEAFEDIRTILDEIWDKLSPIVSYLEAFRLETLEFVFNAEFDRLKNSFEGLEAALGAIAAIIRGDFSDAFGHLKELIIDVPINRIKNNINRVLSAIETAVNWVIRKLNSIGSFDIPDGVPIFGGSKIGFDFSEIKIPRLAKGGVVPYRTVAEIGEAGKEAVLPLENNTEWMDILADKIASRSGTQGINVSASGSWAQFIRFLKFELDKEGTRSSVWG